MRRREGRKGRERERDKGKKRKRMGGGELSMERRWHIMA